MKIFIKENWFKLVIATAIILVGLSIFYYFVIFASQKEQTRLNQEAQKQLLQEQEKQATEEQTQEQIQATNEIKSWDNLKNTVEGSISASSKIRSDAEDQMSKNRQWL